MREIGREVERLNLRLRPETADLQQTESGKMKFHAQEIISLGYDDDICSNL